MPVVIIVNNVGLCGKKRIPSRGTTTNMLASSHALSMPEKDHARVGEENISPIERERGTLGRVSGQLDSVHALRQGIVKVEPPIGGVLGCGRGVVDSDVIRTSSVPIQCDARPCGRRECASCQPKKCSSVQTIDMSP